MFNAVTYLKIINKKLNSSAQYNKCILFGTYCLNNMRLKLYVNNFLKRCLTRIYVQCTW